MNQIERSIDLKAPVDRVWEALTNHDQFGTWFRVSLHSPFVVGDVTYGEVTFPGHEGLPFWVRVQDMIKPRYFSFVWPMDETVEPDDPDITRKSTLVEFAVKPNGTGCRLSIRESGFAALPATKRMQVFRDNEGGWDAQTQHIKDHVE